MIYDMIIDDFDAASFQAWALGLVDSDHMSRLGLTV